MVKESVMKSVIKSYIRGVLIAITPLISIHNTDPMAYLVAIFAGVIGPALRAMDSKDASFGIVADIAEAEIDKLAKASAKKKQTKS
jgi:hypothetical protein